MAVFVNSSTIFRKVWHGKSYLSKNNGSFCLLGNPLVRMFNDGTGSILDNFAQAARGHMNATFELVKTGMRIELDVYQATQKLFSHPAYSCRCVNWHEEVRTVQLLIHG